MSLLGDDIQLLHRKALALLGLGQRASATDILEKILRLDPNLEVNPEIASLEGRIFREQWEALLGSGLIAEAIKEYQRGWERHPKPGPRQCQSALGGVRRMQAFRKLADADIAPIITLFEGKD